MRRRDDANPLVNLTAEAGVVSPIVLAFSILPVRAYATCLRSQVTANYKGFPIAVKQKSLVVESRSD